MNKFIRLIPICIVSFFIFSKCATPSKLYVDGTREKYMKGKLSDSSYFSLKAYLQQSLPAELKDTIIIKYDFNSHDCWYILDEKEDDYILSVLHSYEQGIADQAAKRPGITILEYREDGDKISKYKKWNKSIKIDDGFLQKLFFKE